MRSVREKLAFAGLLMCGCAASTPSSADLAWLRARVTLGRDATVRGARFVPEHLETVDDGAQPASSRGFVQGIRYAVDAQGAVKTAEQRLDDVSIAAPLPSRLGGGVLFVAGDVVYRADEWLSTPDPVFRSPRGVKGLSVGLDRVYLVTGTGVRVALDPSSGKQVGLGPFPGDPAVGDFVAFDGWSAVALTELRGPVFSRDGGASFHRLDVPLRALSLLPVRRDAQTGALRPLDLDAAPDAIVVSQVALPQLSESTEAPCAMIGPNLTVGPAARCGDLFAQARRRVVTRRADTTNLRRAVLDGWPVDGSTALVLGDGRLVQVSLLDGSVVDASPVRGDLPLLHCHAVPLPAPPGGRGPEREGVGFVCGSPAGQTTLVAYDARARRLRPIRIFAGPRRVVAGAGGWIVGGSCDEDVERRVAADDPTFCVGSPGAEVGAATWREVRLSPGRSARVTVLSDGRVARLQEGAGAIGGTLELVDAAGTVSSVALRASDLSPALRAPLERATWLDSLEERSPGVLGGWLTVDGTVLGAQVDLDGTVRLGAYLRELGSPFVAGRYGLGWTRSKRGYETTDGGMTWAPFTAPGRLAPSFVRACGPAGCLVDGWIRVGWGEPAPASRGGGASVPTVVADGRTPPPVRLTCRLAEPAPPGDDASAEPRTSGRGSSPSAGSGVHGRPKRDALAQIQVDLDLAFDALARGSPLGHLRASGPASGPWGPSARWVAQWRSPFGSASTMATTALTPAPYADVDAARSALGLGRGLPSARSLFVAEDPSHALLLTRVAGRPVELSTLDEHGYPAPLVRADGGRWGRVDAALRVDGAWIVANSEDDSRRRVSLFRSDGGAALAITTLSRALGTSPAGPVRLARGDTEATVGVIVDGPPLAGSSSLRRWVVPVDVESGETKDPEPLGNVDLSDRERIGACPAPTGEGWVFDTTWPGASITLDLAGMERRAALGRPFVRLRVSEGHACIVRLAGDVSEDLRRVAPRSNAPNDDEGGSPDDREVPVVAMTPAAVALRCSLGTK